MNLKRWRTIESILFLLSVILISCAQYMNFIYVPNERLMGPVQRIFYFHVGAAVSTYSAVGIVLICSLIYLAGRDKLSDIISVAAAEVGFLFCSITLISGMIWGHAAWNTWFNWEPRLVTFLLLWLILLSLNLMRAFADPQKVAAQSAVLGIIASINVPLVVFSIKFLPKSAQLHPQILENRGLKDPSFIQALILSMIALFIFQLFLVSIRSRIELIKRNKQAKLQ